MKKLALHWKIIIGMVLGIVFGAVMLPLENGQKIVAQWINPFGIIFIRLLKLIAIPLILGALIKGISDLKDITKFKSIGIKTITTYICTTIFAIGIGLSVVNIIKPGTGIKQETINALKATYAQNQKIQGNLSEANKQQNASPLQFLIDIVPENIFGAASKNANMLQVIFFAILLGITILLVPSEKAKPVKDFFDSLNELVLKMVDMIMVTAPVAVFALLANVVVNSNDSSIILALAKYALTVIIGLILMIGFYLLILKIYTKKSSLWFLKRIAPAQLLAFSTSSSAATLPVTIQQVEEHMGVEKEVSSFVLPVGATINMDGTSLYQAVAAVFIMQVLWAEGLIFPTN